MASAAADASNWAASAAAAAAASSAATCLALFLSSSNLQKTAPTLVSGYDQTR